MNFMEFGPVLVAGSSGASCETADTVIQMDRYEPKEITAEAKEAASAYPGLSLPEVKPVIPEVTDVRRKIRGPTS